MGVFSVTQLLTWNFTLTITIAQLYGLKSIQNRALAILYFALYGFAYFVSEGDDFPMERVDDNPDDNGSAVNDKQRSDHEK